MQSGTIKQKLLAALLSLSIILTLVGGGIAGRTGISAESDTGEAAVSEEPIVHYTFDDAGNRFANSAGDNNFEAQIVNQPSSGSVISTDSEHGGYLDLTEQGNSSAGAFLSVPGEILQGLDEMTIEMEIRTDATGGNNWAFFAAPNDTPQNRDESEHYIAAILQPKVMVHRFANEGERPWYSQFETPAWPYDATEWHTIRVVFAKDYTRLYIDGQSYAGENTFGSLKLKDCVSSNGDYSDSILYFGGSTRPGEGFNGCIDNIKIWAYANDIPDPYVDTDEDSYIITDDVVEPNNTVVNMFDYWITGQTENDYRPSNVGSLEAIMSNGINTGHPFLFAGWDSVKHSYSSLPVSPNSPNSYISGKFGDVNTLGSWNNNQGNINTPGIVANLLGQDGYPQLSGSMTSYGVLPAELCTAEKLTESLAYLFDPKIKLEDGKASYPDVTGLFRLSGGYYYFDSAKTFAELNIQDGDLPAKADHSGDADGNHITLYGKGDGENVEGVWKPIDPTNPPNRSRGQFFPFNDWSDLFHLENGSLVQNHDYIYYQNMPGYEQMNHYFGMTVETEFVQPVNGMVNHGEEPMKFEFSGDDDVWIFIDDVLVCDLGGMHAKLKAEVNFSDGSITVTAANVTDPVAAQIEKTTLQKKFADALGSAYDPADFKGDTFASGTTHTLKFFYLERGNNVSNCQINFNLQSVQPDVIQKADENGNGLEGAVFELYPTELKNGKDPSGQLSAEDFVDTTSTEPLITIITSGEDGSAEFRYEDNVYKDDDFIIVFADLEYEYYILREVDAPTGYRINNDIILQYHKKDIINQTGSNTFTVVNKSETGAYASFSVYFEQLDLNNVYTATYANGTQNKNEDNTVSSSELAEGLTFVVPTMKVGNEWLPLYGSNASGWTTVQLNGSDYKQALLEAAIRQIAEDGAPEMYMVWNAFANGGGSLSAALEDVPGNAERYIGNNPATGDLSYATLFVPKDVLAALGLNGTASYAGSDELFKALKDAVKTSGADNAVNAAKGKTGLELLYTNNFDRTYRTIIHIIDMQQKLVIRKADTDGNPLSGAVFALYDNAGKAAAGGDDWLISDTTKADGIIVLTFDKLANGLPDGQYWLREIKAPDGYKTNPNLIQVIVDNTYIFANATAYTFVDGDQPKAEKVEVEDNVKVYAAVGTLAQSVIRFTDNDILNDIQLKQIIGEVHTAAQADSGYTLSWGDSTESFDLYFNGNGQNESFKYTLLDYAKVENFDPDAYEDIDAMLDALGIVGTEDGFICIKPVKDGIDMSPMFSLLNIIEVTDEKEEEEEEEEEVDIDIEKDQSVNGGERTTDRLVVRKGNLVTYYLTITITSSSGTEGAELKGIVVQDMVPEGLQLIESMSGSITPEKDGAKFSWFTVDNTYTYVQWILGTAKVGDTYTLSYTAEVPPIKESITWENTAYVITGYEDTNPPPCPSGPDDPNHNRNRWKPSKTVEIFADPVTVTTDMLLNVSKTLIGRDWIEGFDEFSFELTGYDSETLDAIANGYISIADGRVIISKEGQNAAFGDITFNIDGEFSFIVTETDRKNGSVDYDETVYVITVNVIENSEGLLEIGDVTVIRLEAADADIESGETVAADENTYTLAFENGYNAICSWPPVIIKQVSGRSWREADEFEFILELIGPDGVDEGAVIMPENIIVTGTADSFDDVTASFGEVTFTKPGLYTFRLSEKLPEGGHNSGGLIFDKGYYVLTVNVTDNGGTLEFSLVGVTRFENEDDTEGTAYYDEAYRFTNTYSLIFDDDGVPRGDMFLPEGDPEDNMPTGVAFGGKAYIAVGTLLVSSAALVVRKRRRGRNEK